MPISCHFRYSSLLRCLEIVNLELENHIPQKFTDLWRLEVVWILVVTEFFVEVAIMGLSASDFRLRPDVAILASVVDGQCNE